MYLQTVLSEHTVIHANVIDDRNGNKNQFRIEEVPNDSKGVVSFDNNLPILICINVSYLGAYMTICSIPVSAQEFPITLKE